MIISSWNVNSVRARIENIKEYLNKLEIDQRKRLPYDQRNIRVEKRNKMIALIRKLKLELGEDI